MNSLLDKRLGLSVTLFINHLYNERWLARAVFLKGDGPNYISGGVRKGARRGGARKKMTYLEEIEKLCKEATPGPWPLCYHLQSFGNDKKCPCGYRGSIWGHDDHVICEMGSTVIKDEEGLEPPRYSREQELINAKFIAASRELMPKFLEIAKAATEVCKNHHDILCEESNNSLCALNDALIDLEVKN